MNRGKLLREKTVNPIVMRLSITISLIDETRKVRCTYGSLQTTEIP